MFACFDLIGVNYEIQSLTGKILCLIKILLWLNITQGKNHTQPSINDSNLPKSCHKNTAIVFVSSMGFWFTVIKHLY